MRPSVARIASTLGLAVTLGLTFTSLGCDSTQALPFPASSPSPNGPEVPRSTERAMTKCAEGGISRLTTDYNTVIFEVTATKSGEIKGIRVKGSDIPGDPIEGCVKEALGAMHISPWIVSLGSPAPGEKNAVSKDSRGQMGIVQVLGPLVQLAPIVVAAGGITLILVVTVVIAVELVEAAKPRKNNYDDECMPLEHECLENVRQPDWNKDFGENKDCGACVRECRHRKGVWPVEKCPRPN